MSYEVVRHATAEAFLQRAEAWLQRAEDLNNVVLDIAFRHIDAPPAGEDPFFATVEEGDRVVGCAVRSPPYPVLLTDMPLGAGEAVARHLADLQGAIPGVRGSAPTAEAFAATWVGLRGGTWQPGTDQRLYRLDAVPAPSEASGGLRRATPDDAELLAEWARGFMEEVHLQFDPGTAPVQRWIERGSLFVWDAGGPASMTVAHGRTPRGIRIGYVYTPPGRRGRGYAGACVAEVSRKMLESGVGFCVLYADLSNPTSNALYQRMGYYPVADVRDYYIRAEAPP